MKNISNPVNTYKVSLGHESEEELQSLSVKAQKQTSPAPNLEGFSRPPAIAVLPFANMGGDPEQEYFADGITEDIITNLSFWRTFPVIFPQLQLHLSWAVTQTKASCRRTWCTIH